MAAPTNPSGLRLDVLVSLLLLLPIVWIARRALRACSVALAAHYRAVRAWPAPLRWLAGAALVLVGLRLLRFGLRPFLVLALVGSVVVAWAALADHDARRP